MIELAVVVAIIGIMAALIIPAVASVREAGRRAQCADHLRQIGTALANHASQRGRFPAGFLPSSSDGARHPYSAPILSVHFQLLPWLEQAALHDSMNTEVYTYAIEFPQNRTAAETVVDVFHCPSDQADGPGPGSNFRACVGSMVYLHEGCGGPGDGTFSCLHALTPAEIRDGLSTTVAFSERTRGGGGTTFDPRRDIWLSGYDAIRVPRDADEMMAICARLVAPPEHAWTAAGRWWCISLFADTQYNHVAPPNWEQADCSAGRQTTDPGDISDGAIGARSEHPGGVHLLMLDGSVRFGRSGVDLQVWRALATRAGGEVIAADTW